ncbi:MAG: DUF2442 domain-containing protein [Lachnospiraceae bacterium]|nr:DUF2442 domain-containing protein [Lachnospiraceae bacterium]
MSDYFPEIVQVVPHKDYTVSVYFSDGKIVLYNVKPLLEKGLFTQLKDIHVFMNSCMILNDTLAWDIAGNRDESRCIDIDPDQLYSLPSVNEQTA